MHEFICLNRIRNAVVHLVVEYLHPLEGKLRILIQQRHIIARKRILTACRTRTNNL